MTYPSPPPTPAPAPAPARRKSNTGLIVGIIVGVILLICVGTIGAVAAFGLWAQDRIEDTIANLPTAEPAQPGNGRPNGPAHTVRYEVEGSGEATLNWGKGTGGQESITTGLPWSTEITVSADTFGTIVSAVPRGKDTSIKSCRILVDGKETKKVEAGNGFAICTATYLGKA